MLPFIYNKPFPPPYLGTSFPPFYFFFHSFSDLTTTGPSIRLGAVPSHAPKYLENRKLRITMEVIIRGLLRVVKLRSPALPGKRKPSSFYKASVIMILNQIKAQGNYKFSFLKNMDVKFLHNILGN